jgi:enoyl-CoA hydratase/carnithine racemase
MSQYTQISFEVANEVATLTLLRPQRLNALTDTINEELFDAFNCIEQDQSIKVVVLTGEGRAFSAGYDLSFGGDMPERDVAWWNNHFRLAFRTLKRMWTLPQPIVAKAPGPAVGGGFALFLLCDLAYGAEHAVFGEPEVKFGGAGTMAPLLAWYLGIREFKELLLTGRTLSAKRAVELGLLNEAVPADQLDARVNQVVRHMCLLPPGTLVKSKAGAQRCYEFQGVSQLMDMVADSTTANSALRTKGPEDEFTRLSREENVSAALKWQKQRFDEVGAYPK